jgi:predicted MFS family arabinose efflux permease
MKSTSTAPQAGTASDAKPSKFTAYQKFVIAILALLQFTVVLDFMILAPLGDILMKTMGLSAKQFSYVVAAYAFSAGISGFLAAGFADKFDRKKLLLFFYVGFVIGTAFCGLANSYYTLLLARIVTGIFGGVIGSIGMAIITDIFNLQQRGRVMGFVQMAFAGSQILGVPIGIEIANRWGWHASFFMIVGFSFLLGVLVLLRLRPIDGHLKIQKTSNPIAHLFGALSKKDYRIGFMATAILSMGGFMIMPFSTAFLINNIHVPQNSLSIIFVATGIASTIIMPLVGALSDRVDKFKLFTAGSILAAIMILVYTNLQPVPVWVVIFVNVLLFMGIMSRMVPAMAMNSAIPAMSDRGAFMSINSSLQQLAGGVGGIVAGLIVVKAADDPTAPIENFDILGYVMVAVVVLCIFLMARVSKMIKQRNHAEGAKANPLDL